MELTDIDCNQFIAILQEELVPALGCTEPIAIAYAGAHARTLLGKIPDRVCIKSSGNIIKNVKSVTVPNSGNMKGIPAAAAIGIIGGNPDKGLEVLADITEADIARTKEFLEKVPCKVSLLDTVASLHFIVEVFAGADSASVEIIHQHTNIVRTTKNGKDVLSVPFDPASANAALTDRSGLSVKKILEFADTIELDRVRPILERQIDYNTRIAQEGLEHRYGINAGANLLKAAEAERAVTVKIRAQAAAAAGSDARMSGCTLPVVTNSGSGNQGLTASLPVIVFAEEKKLPHDKLLRGLLVSNLIAIHQKTRIGRLSAYCGAVSAACGSGAAVTYLSGGSYEQVCETITNTLAVVSGIVCDGAKPSCASKIASSVDAALNAHYLAMQNRVFEPGEGIVKGDIEKTIAGVGAVAADGMRETDKVILKIMVED
ncbi:serine dehydratase subunit alpha family protein [Treponema sp. OMZ 305]|uniref:L-cysteine desulfidase family protein n=1 Tax=Treponema sp. OMZ 305 TaxID=1659192 RepID=UPI0020A29978|nr:L-serine ammonia-lyase, iron-sulfur-dependent, subunit alpha [Treponema sp. OMZ 305]UTC58182.1 serine dehydratase subunit alpha family protein [Treponema sp. OMZ 305]